MIDISFAVSCGQMFNRTLNPNLNADISAQGHTTAYGMAFIDGLVECDSTGKRKASNYSY